MFGVDEEKQRSFGRFTQCQGRKEPEEPKEGKEGMSKNLHRLRTLYCKSERSILTEIIDKSWFHESEQLGCNYYYSIDP